MKRSGSEKRGSEVKGELLVHLLPATFAHLESALSNPAELASAASGPPSRALLVGPHPAPGPLRPVFGETSERRRHCPLLMRPLWRRSCLS